MQEYIPEQLPPQKKTSRKTLIIIITIIILMLFVSFLFFMVFISFRFYNPVSTAISTANNFIIKPTPTDNPIKINKEKQLQEAGEGVFNLYNNFDYLYPLSREEERKLGVYTLPDDALKATSIRGIALYNTSCRSFSDEEIVLLKKFLGKIPRALLDYPPKAIISACLEIIDISPDSLTNAAASGPYIYIGDEFFTGTLLSGELSENKKYAIFMHEYAHIFEYYFKHHYFMTDIRPQYTDIQATSSLVYDFAQKVGWRKQDASEHESYFNPSGTWILDDTIDAMMTTEYGKEGGPVEDFADTFGWYVAGHPQIFSSARISYIASFFNLPESVFTNGVIPRYPNSIPVKSEYETYLKNEIDSIESRGLKQIDEDEWAVSKSIGFTELFSYYSQKLTDNNFIPVKQLNSTAGDEFAYGEYRYDDVLYAVSILGSVTTGVETFTTGSYVQTVSHIFTIPDNYVITVLRFE